MAPGSGTEAHALDLMTGKDSEGGTDENAIDVDVTQKVRFTTDIRPFSVLTSQMIRSNSKQPRWMKKFLTAQKTVQNSNPSSRTNLR
jgi:hypothetical protein